jgi:hypothetical protein
VYAVCRAQQLLHSSQQYGEIHKSGCLSYIMNDEKNAKPSSLVDVSQGKQQCLKRQTIIPGLAYLYQIPS